MAALIWCPFPDEEAALAAGQVLLDEQLVACCNILGSMTSLFAWQGETSRSVETGVLFKTDSSVLTAAVARLEKLHPYAEPAILGWHCDAAAEATRTWLGALARGGNA
ncbi:MAG: divalent-cation tolerance protein CutA [Sphingomonadaceae bacterium]|nr:divalent-cation tolerance protein CutA [Sphingomonadaceae bacterium]